VRRADQSECRAAHSADGWIGLACTGELVHGWTCTEAHHPELKEVSTAHGLLFGAAPAQRGGANRQSGPCGGAESSAPPSAGAPRCINMLICSRRPQRSVRGFLSFGRLGLGRHWCARWLGHARGCGLCQNPAGPGPDARRRRRRGTDSEPAAGAERRWRAGPSHCTQACAGRRRQLLVAVAEPRRLLGQCQ
jgi:hypothetical protein